MRVDVLGLQAFIAIADHGSFVDAAKAMNLSQTALSHRIGKLEDDLGLPLFIRTTRKLALSREGLDLLPRARRAIDDLENALTDLKELGQLKRRELTMGCIPSLAVSILAAVLRDFSVSMPQIRLRVLDGYARAIAAQVNNGEAEFGLVVRQGTFYELDFHPIATEPFVAVCAVDHPLAHETTTTWEALQDHVLIGNSVIDQSLRPTETPFHWTYQAENISTAISFVKQGLGVTLVPAFEQRQPGYTGLKSLAVTSPEVIRQIGFITRPDMHLSDASRALMSLIEIHLDQIGKAAAQARPPRSA
ncbi:MAG: LysR family transcriptional regulator [Qingshengfaniella sp.]